VRRFSICARRTGGKPLGDAMRLLLLLLALLTTAIQYPLWWGKGGWLRVAELRAQIAQQSRTTAELLARNHALAAEVQSLQTGKEAIEERARRELGLIRTDEIFVQILVPNSEPEANHISAN